jgi:predicted  nucleic acid-binding Zn-ribbon protein
METPMKDVARKALRSLQGELTELNGSIDAVEHMLRHHNNRRDSLQNLITELEDFIGRIDD